MFARAALHEPSRGLFDTGSRNTEFAFKINHTLTARNNLGARYAFSRGRELNDVQSLDNFTEKSARGSSLTTDHSVVLEWTALLSPKLVNDLRGQISKLETERKELMEEVASRDRRLTRIEAGEQDQVDARLALYQPNTRRQVGQESVGVQFGAVNCALSANAGGDCRWHVSRKRERDQVSVHSDGVSHTADDCNGHLD